MHLERNSYAYSDSPVFYEMLAEVIAARVPYDLIGKALDVEALTIALYAVGVARPSVEVCQRMRFHYRTLRERRGLKRG